MAAIAQVECTLFSSLSCGTFEIKTLLVRGCLWWHTALVFYARWPQLLCPPSPQQWQAAMTSKNQVTVSFLTNHQSAQLRLRSPRLSVVEINEGVAKDQQLLKSKADVSKELSQVDQD